MNNTTNFPVFYEKFGYSMRLKENDIYFKFPKSFLINETEYYLINNSQKVTRDKILACNSKEDIENMIKDIKKVTNEQ